MLVNIWATITHLGDADFIATTPSEPSLDLLICDGLRQTTTDRQIWAINPCYCHPGITSVLLRESYVPLRDASESYLVLFTPGFADVKHRVPVELFRCQLREIARRARAFNKRIVTTILGVPPKAPADVGDRIGEMNGAIHAVTSEWDGVAVDLRHIAFTPWTHQGSRPQTMSDAAKLIVDGIMQSHCAADEWRALQSRSG